MYPYDCFMVVINSVIMADFLMSETQHPVLVVILIIDSSYFLKFLVELEEYIVSRTAINSSLFIIYSSHNGLQNS